MKEYLFYLLKFNRHYSSKGDLHEMSGKAMLFVLIIAAVVIYAPKILDLISMHTTGAGSTISGTFNS